MVACLVVMLSNAGAAPLNPTAEDRYIATRDAAIKRFSSVHDAGRFDDATQKGEETARADLQAQSAILGELNRKGFGPATLNLSTWMRVLACSTACASILNSGRPGRERVAT
jgi:hypothetical protein